MLREDNRAIVRAAALACKDSDFLLGFLNGPAGQGTQGEHDNGGDGEAEPDVAAAA